MSESSPPPGFNAGSEYGSLEPGVTQPSAAIGAAPAAPQAPTQAIPAVEPSTSTVPAAPFAQTEAAPAAPVTAPRAAEPGEPQERPKLDPDEIAAMVLIPSSPATSSGSLGRFGQLMGGGRGWIGIGLIFAVLAMVGVVLATTAPTSDAPRSTDSPVSEVIGGGAVGSGAAPLSGDTDARAAVSAAVTAIETYAVGTGGSYTGATPDALRAIDGSLSSIGLTVSASEAAYTLSVRSTGGNTFSISRGADGTQTRTCSVAGSGDCPANGYWG